MALSSQIVDYFADQLSEQVSRGVRNSVTDVRLVSVTWRRHGPSRGGINATVAMRFSDGRCHARRRRECGRREPDHTPPRPKLEHLLGSRGGHWICPRYSRRASRRCQGGSPSPLPVLLAFAAKPRLSPPMTWAHGTVTSWRRSSALGYLTGRRLTAVGIGPGVAGRSSSSTVKWMEGEVSLLSILVHRTDRLVVHCQLD